jgi:hypothetical protein
MAIITIITLSLQMSDVGEDFRVGHCDLSPAYANVIDNDDITELNPSATTSKRGIDLGFFTCFRPLYVV